MKRYIFPILILLLVVIELVLAFYGPMALVTKPSLLISAPFGYRLEGEESEQVFQHLMRTMARTRLFRVIPPSFIAKHYEQKLDRPDFNMEELSTYTDYKNLAEEMELDRLLVCSIYSSKDEVNVSLVLRDVRNKNIVQRISYRSADIQSFINGREVNGEDFSLVSDFRLKTKGISLFDNLFLSLLAGQAVLSAALLLRKKPDLLNQLLIIAGLLVCLFAFIYAKNASMDYVQRFIANEGQIQLAEDTATEQLHTMLRFVPLLLLNGGYYIFLRTHYTDAHTDIWKRWALPFALLSALLYALAFPSFLSLAGFPVLAWFCLIPLFLVLLYSKFIYALLYGIAFGALSTLLMNYWHGTYSYISLAFSVLLSTLLYLLWMLPFVFMLKKSKKWGFFIAALFWLAFDYVRTQGYLGYPWGFLGVSNYSFLPLIQIADLTGVWGITFVLVFWNASLAWSAAAPHFGWSWAGRRWLPAASAGAIVLLTLSYGSFRLLSAAPEEAKRMRVVLVQQNRDPRKHQFQDSYRTIVRLTNEAMRETRERKPDLIVWPEGAFMKDMRYWLDRPSSRSGSVGQVERFLEYQKRLGTWLVTGTQDHTYETNDQGDREKRNFNSSVLLSDKGEIAGYYHKMHLVPFTEHFPYREEYPWLAKLLDKFGTSNWKQGEERTIFEHPAARFFTPICFEDIFPDDLRRFVLQGAELIVNMSNDFWSLTPVEGKQHAIHSMFRAVENRRPMVRATGSGLTTYITVKGKMSRDFPAYYSRGYLVADIPIAEGGTTFYTRHGDWFPRLCLFLTLIAACILALAHFKKGVILR